MQLACWVRPNAGQILEDFHGCDCAPEFGATWCEDCEEHTVLVMPAGR